MFDRIAGCFADFRNPDLIVHEVRSMVGQRILGLIAGLEGAARALIAHGASGYEEWGASAAARIDPGESGRGLSFTLTPTWGNAGSAAERLWGAADARGLAPDGAFEAGRHLVAELGYGLRASPGVVTPFAGIGLADGGSRRLRLGARWALGPATSLGLTFSLRW